VWAALYGVIFRFLVRTFQLPGAAAVLGGILYSLLVMLFMSFVVLPIVWLSEMPALVGWPSFTVEHLLFGLVLGFWPVLRPQDFAIAASQTSSITPVRGHPASLFSSREEAELLPPKQAGQPLRLEIYVSSECSNCQEALLIAEQARGIAGLEVDVVHIDDPDCLVPPSVFAVPTYILDGRVVSMGNPAREAFLAELRQRLRNA
jgi:hypothetical protein